MAAFSDQFERWPTVKLVTSLSGSKLVSKIGFHARMAMSESLSDQRLANLCMLIETRVFKKLDTAHRQDEFDKFRFIYQQIERGFAAGDGLPFGVKPEQVCAAVVFWKLADAQDAKGLEREAQLALAIDFLTLGIWLSTQYQTSDKDAKALSRKLDVEKKEASTAAKEARWEGHQEVVEYARSLAKEKVWDSVAYAASVILPKVQVQFPTAKFSFGLGAVSSWIDKDLQTVRRLNKAKSKN